MELTLIDNGKGMTEEAARNLLKISLQEEKSRGIGVINVDQRLKLHFGNEYGLSVDSTLGKGTIIRMTWPKRRTKVD